MIGSTLLAFMDGYIVAKKDKIKEIEVILKIWPKSKITGSLVKK